MKFSATANRAQTTPSRLRKASEASPRSRSNLTAQRKGAIYASSNSHLNKVLFTIPWSVQFGESLSVSGEGEELGSWSPTDSLPLKWNEGDLWAAEVCLPAGEKREYKYVIKDQNGHLKSWQPGSNCAVEVPKEADASLQVADDWHGKARSVIYKDGEVQAAPSGTFNGPPAQASAGTAAPDIQSNTVEANQDPSAAVSFTAVSSPPGQAATPQSTAAQANDPKANGAQANYAQASGAQANDAQATGAQANDAQAIGVQANGATPASKPVTQVVEPHEKLVDDETGVPLEELPVKALQKRLRNRKQKVSGKKADLIDRLQSIDP